jgi:hypothetical protein
VAVVSPDSHEVMIASGDERGFAVERHVAVGPDAAHAGGDRGRRGWWSTAQDDGAACSSCGRTGPGSGRSRLALPRASRPYGVVADGEAVYVGLQATGQLARVDFAGGKPVLKDILDVGPRRARGQPAAGRAGGGDALALAAGRGDRVGDRPGGRGGGGVDACSSTRRRPRTPRSGGVPSYLGPVVLAPTGDLAVVPGLQINVGQGLFLNGEPLAADLTMRAIVAYLDPQTGAEWFERRKQFDNRGMADAALFSRFGDYLYVATRGPRTVERVDVLSGDVAGNTFDAGYAPQGLALSEDDRFLFIDAYMSRELVVHDTRVFDDPVPPLVRLPIPSVEPLAPQLLQGKRLFNDSLDPRLSQDGYLACAHCHLDGDSDRQVWDFTDRGEGLRDTISLLGRAGAGDGGIHWSANFDEIQDFEHDIRGPFGGLGLMGEAEWQTGSVASTLGDPKAGLSADLDALAAYVGSLTEERRSPHREADGALPAAAELGQALFESPALGCKTCHSGPRLTDSGWIDPGVPLLHDVGTLGPGSGQRLGAAVDGARHADAARAVAHSRRTCTMVRRRTSRRC